MIQIAYEPAFDPFHSSFRMLRQLQFRGCDNKFLIQRLKLLDVFVVEPFRCLDIRLSGKLKSAARKASLCQQATYGRKPSASVLFNRMSPMQDAAIQTMVLQGILSETEFSLGYALRGISLPGKLQERINDINVQQKDLMVFICQMLDEIPFDGTNGLKHRTGLGEYRYDVV